MSPVPVQFSGVSPDDLRTLARSEDATPLREVFDNPRCPEDVLQDFAERVQTMRLRPLALLALQAISRRESAAIPRHPTNLDNLNLTTMTT